MNKNFLFIILGIGVIALVITTAAIYRFNTSDSLELARNTNTTEQFEEQDDVSGDRSTNPENLGGPTGKIKADVFTGKLEVVDTGCFADGECFVTVDGKHVTALRGWSRDTVGSIEGVDSFGDLEKHIGETVEVYAQVNVDGTYTLYGSEGFYIKLISGAGTPKSAQPLTKGECVIGGCSSQLCVDTSLGDIMSTCEYREEYACYQSATCERQSNGQCGWTETKELNECLLTKKGSSDFEVQ